MTHIERLINLVSNIANEIKNRIHTNKLGVANGVATLNNSGKIPNAQLDIVAPITLPGYSLGVEVLTTERWIDGKPIYRKVVSGVIPSPAADITIASGLTTEEYCTIDDFYMETSTGRTVSGTYSYYASTSEELLIYYTKPTHNISVFVSNSYAQYAGRTIYIILKYTKTTDSAASPTAVVGCGVVQTGDHANNIGFTSSAGLQATTVTGALDELNYNIKLRTPVCMCKYENSIDVIYSVFGFTGVVKVAAGVTSFYFDTSKYSDVNKIIIECCISMSDYTSVTYSCGVVNSTTMVTDGYVRIITQSSAGTNVATVVYVTMYYLN